MAQSKSKIYEPMWDDGNEEKGIATLEQVEDGEFDLVADIDDLPEVSKVLEQEQKVYLDTMRKKVRTMIDGKKLTQAVCAIKSMENMMAILSDDEMMIRVRENVSTPMDLKFLAEAYEKVAKQVQNLTRLDTVDGAGTGAKVALAVQFGNGSGGTTVVQVGIEDK
jgi:hypothetical protein